MRGSSRVVGWVVAWLAGSMSFGQAVEETETLCDRGDPLTKCPGVDCACVDDTIEVVFDGDSQSLLEYETFVPGLPIEATVITETMGDWRQGWSYGIAHDDKVLALAAVGAAGTTADGLISQGWQSTRMDLVQTCLTDRCDQTDPAQRRTGGGWIQAFVLSFVSPVSLPVSRNSLAWAQYALSGDVGTEGSLIRFTDRLALVDSPPTDLNLTVEGKARRWTTATVGRVRRKAGPDEPTERGRILCDVLDPANRCPGDDCVCRSDALEVTFDGGSRSTLEYDEFQQDLLVDVTVISDTKSYGVQGWSYGMAHVEEDLTIVSATLDGTDARVLLSFGFDATSTEDLQTCLTERCDKADPAQRRDGGGWVSAVVLSFTLPVLLPQARNTVARASYTLSRDVGPEGTLIQATSRLAKRNAPPTQLNLTVGGKTRLWSTTIDGWVKRAGGLATPFLRGDVGVGGQGDEGPADGRLDVTDAIRTLREIFLGWELELYCEKAVDANDDGEVSPTDAVHVLGYLFLGGAAPPAPFPDVGYEETPDDLTCGRYP